MIVESIKKTNRVIFADEDVSGGASAYMMQKVLDEQDAYQWLDTAPRCISAEDHRTAYSTDGDYFSKPSADDVFDIIYECHGIYFFHQHLVVIVFYYTDNLSSG